MTNREFGGENVEGRIELSELGKTALIRSGYFACAFLVSSVSENRYFSPLGIAFSAAADRQNTLFSCLGAMAGYIVSEDYVSAFRYVMALILVYILKVYVNTFKKLEKKNFVPGIIALFSSLSTGIVSMITEPFTVQLLFLVISESLSSFGSAYVFAVGFKAGEKLRGDERITSKEITSLVTALLLAVLSLSELSLFGVTLSGILCSYAVLTGAYLFNEQGGALMGTAAALGFTLTGGGTPAVFCYSGAGLFTGLFSYSGRFLCAFAYVFSYGALYVFSGGGENLLPLAETTFATVLFVLTPQRLLFRIKMKFSQMSSADGREVREMLVSRIRTVSNAVTDVADTVERVSKALDGKTLPDSAAVYLKVRDNVCEKCASFGKCWKVSLSVTLEDFDAILDEIRRTGSVVPSTAPISLRSRCIRIMSVCDSFNKNYVSYSAHLGAEGRINEMRKITADQFDTVREMLDDLVDGFCNGATPLAEKSDALRNSLEDIGVTAFVNCYEDENMNTIINLSVPGDCRAGTEEIRGCIEKSTGREFPLPAVIPGNDERMMLFWEKTVLSAECVYHQISGSGEETCGDNFDFFFDGRGNFIAVLSDGMGTGERAAIDSAMAASLFSRLIISGFSFPCALRLVNSAMLVKGTDESLATLDIVRINLYNGKTSVYKAGATVSLLLRRGKVTEIKKSAMPIGILRQAEFGTVRGTLRDGDVLIIMSDGAADKGINEIKEYVVSHGFSYDLPEKLCTLARGKNNSRSDDITVAVIKIGLNNDD